AAFDALFAQLQEDADNATPTEAELELRRIRARNKSVLDAVRESFSDLTQGLGADDRRILEEHADRIRRLELDVVLGESCTIPGGIAGGGNPRLKMDQIAP